MQNFDDSALGRARVVDNSELTRYYSDIEKIGFGALWKVANDIEPWEPHSLTSICHWEYEKIRPHLIRSTELVTPQQAGRRVLYLINPKRKDIRAACGMLYAGLQITNPGEFTPAHHHKASALRFIIEGQNGYTIVNGHRIALNALDFVITPNGCWHEHGVEKNGKTCIWLDGLDIPMVNAFEANDYAVLDGQQEQLFPLDFSPNVFGANGMLPVNHEWNQPFSPLFKYTWENTYKALKNMEKVHQGSPYDGIMMDFVNPSTGGPVMKTLGAAMQMIRPNERTKAHKHTGSIVYCVAVGKGYSIINGQKIGWKSGDTFCVPSWAWHEHANETSGDAFLFQFNDLPVIKSMQWYMERPYEENGGHQNVLS